MLRRCFVRSEVFIPERIVLCEADKMAEFGKSLDVMVEQSEYTTGFAVIETTGLRIGANGTLKNVNVMMLNDLFSVVRDIIEMTNIEFSDENEQQITTSDANLEITDEGKPDEIQMNQDQMEDIEDSDDSDDDEEEEEFKIVIETRNKNRLVLCTCEGICCGMLQIPPYCGADTEQAVTESTANGLNGTHDETKIN